MAKHGSSWRITRPMQWCVKLHVEQKQFLSSQLPGPGLPKAARELCPAAPANIKPSCPIQASLTRESSFSGLDQGWWREMDVEMGAVLRCCSKTSAVVLVCCDGLCLVHWRASLALHCFHQGMPGSGPGARPAEVVALHMPLCSLTWVASNLAASLSPLSPCSRLTGLACSVLAPWGCQRGCERWLLAWGLGSPKAGQQPWQLSSCNWKTAR